MGLLSIIKNALKEPALRKKILMTVLLIVIFRIGCFIPVPGLNENALSGLAGTGMFQFMDLITGGAFENVSLFAMGISPYINASIIIQLLTVAIPALERLQKEGPEGRKKIATITKYTAIGLALFQAIMLFVNLNVSGDNFTGEFGSNWLSNTMIFMLVVISFTAGTAVLTWLGEKITDVGIGNGISVIIFAGIVARAPDALIALGNIAIKGEVNGTTVAKNVAIRIVLLLAIVLVFLAVIVAVVWMEAGERRLAVQYSQRVVGRKLMGGQKSYIPLKVNSTGVLPIIFAMSLLQFPVTIASFFGASKATSALNNFNNTWWYLLLYAVLIVGFTFFYNMVYFDPKEYANNLINNGGQILEIRTTNRKATAEYIGKISKRITWFGSIFLAVLATFPGVLGKICDLIPGLKNVSSLNLWFGGTSVIILVGVALETIRQLEAQLLMRHYKSGKGGFLS